MKFTKSHRIIKSKQCSLFLLVIFFVFFSCKDNRKRNETSNIANEWEDKEILSCGCTNITWDKQPIASGSSTIVQTEITLSEIGSFKKSLIVYCNANESPLILTLSGLAK